MKSDLAARPEGEAENIVLLRVHHYHVSGKTIFHFIRLPCCVVWVIMLQIADGFFYDNKE